MYAPFTFYTGGGHVLRRHCHTINDVSPRRRQRARGQIFAAGWRVARNDRALNIVLYCYTSRTVTGPGRKRNSLDLYYCSPTYVYHCTITCYRRATCKQVSSLGTPSGVSRTRCVPFCTFLLPNTIRHNDASCTNVKGCLS